MELHVCDWKQIVLFFSYWPFSFFNISFYCGSGCFQADWREHHEMHKRRKDDLRRSCSNERCQNTEPVYNMFDPCQWCADRHISNPAVYCSEDCEREDFLLRHVGYHDFITFGEYPDQILIEISDEWTICNKQLTRRVLVQVSWIAFHIFLINVLV